VGYTRQTTVGEVLIATGSRAAGCFVVLAGELEIVRQTEQGTDIIVVHGAGSFTGEISTPSGRPALLTTRVRSSGQVIEVDRERLLALVQTDPDRDVRSGSIKRVASAVGEGSIAVSFVHQALRE
jgi:CRP-like cAMP-binding protein